MTSTLATWQKGPMVYEPCEEDHVEDCRRMDEALWAHALAWHKENGTQGPTCKGRHQQ